MKSYAWLAVRGQLRTSILIAGVVVGVVVPRVGLGQAWANSFPQEYWDPNARAIGDAMRRGNSAPAASPSDKKPPREGNIEETTEESENTSSAEESNTTGQHSTKPVESEEEEEERAEKKAKAEAEEALRAAQEAKSTLLQSNMTEVKGTTVNGQQLYKSAVDGKEFEFYHLNGDPKSNYISMKDGNGYRWTTKNEMLGLKNTGPGGLTETGSLDIGGGRVTSMFQDAAGNRYYSTGEGGSWFKSETGKNSFVANKELSMGRANNLNRYTQNPTRTEFVTKPLNQTSNPALDYSKLPEKTDYVTARVFQPDAVQPSTFKDSPLVQRGGYPPLNGNGGPGGTTVGGGGTAGSFRASDADIFADYGLEDAGLRFRSLTQKCPAGGCRSR